MTTRHLAPALPRFHDGQRHARRRIDSPQVTVRMPDTVGEALARDQIMQAIDIADLLRTALTPVQSAVLHRIEQWGRNR